LSEVVKKTLGARSVLLHVEHDKVIQEEMVEKVTLLAAQR
jgi:hypothetical protein